MQQKIVFLILLHGCWLWAAPQESTPQQEVAMMVATNLEEFLDAEQEARHRRRQQEGCQYELDKKLFPENCFMYLSRQMTDILDLQRTMDLFQKVHKLCLQVASHTESLQTMETILKLKIVSKPCRQALQLRIEDLVYQKQASWHPN